MFYNDATNWGNPQKWDDTKVAAKTTVAVQPLNMKVETFTISFDDLKNGSAVLGISWENVYVGVKFEVPTDKTALKSIESVMAGPSKSDYFQAATYYHTEGKDLKQALTWIKKATEGNDPAFGICVE